MGQFFFPAGRTQPTPPTNLNKKPGPIPVLNTEGVAHRPSPPEKHTFREGQAGGPDTPGVGVPDHVQLLHRRQNAVAANPVGIPNALETATLDTSGYVR